VGKLDALFERICGELEAFAGFLKRMAEVEENED
jgi:hypothetical protein